MQNINLLCTVMIALHLANKLKYSFSKSLAHISRLRTAVFNAKLVCCIVFSHASLDFSSDQVHVV